MSVGGFLSAPDARAEAALARPATADGHVKAFPCILSGFTRISGRNGPRLASQHGKRALDPPRKERPGGGAPLRFASRDFASRDDAYRKRLVPRREVCGRSARRRLPKGTVRHYVTPASPR